MRRSQLLSRGFLSLYSATSIFLRIATVIKYVYSSYRLVSQHLWFRANSTSKTSDTNEREHTLLSKWTMLLGYLLDRPLAIPQKLKRPNTSLKYH